MKLGLSHELSILMESTKRLVKDSTWAGSERYGPWQYGLFLQIWLDQFLPAKDDPPDVKGTIKQLSKGEKLGTSIRLASADHCSHATLWEPLA